MVSSLQALLEYGLTATPYNIQVTVNEFQDSLSQNPLPSAELINATPVCRISTMEQAFTSQTFLNVGELSLVKHQDGVGWLIAEGFDAVSAALGGVAGVSGSHDCLLEVAGPRDDSRLAEPAQNRVQ